MSFERFSTDLASVRPGPAVHRADVLVHSFHADKLLPARSALEFLDAAMCHHVAFERVVRSKASVAFCALVVLFTRVDPLMLRHLTATSEG